MNASAITDNYSSNAFENSNLQIQAPVDESEDFVATTSQDELTKSALLAKTVASQEEEQLNMELPRNIDHVNQIVEKYKVSHMGFPRMTIDIMPRNPNRIEQRRKRSAQRSKVKVKIQSEQTIEINVPKSLTLTSQI